MLNTTRQYGITQVAQLTQKPYRQDMIQIHLPNQGDHLLFSRPMAPYGWTIHWLTDIETINKSISQRLFYALLAYLLLVVAVLLWW